VAGTEWAYPAIFERLEDGEIVVSFRNFPEALTGADDLADAKRLAEDALEEAVLGYLAEGRDVPNPRSARPGEELVLLDPLTAGRAAVLRALRERGLSRRRLAELMGKDEKVVRRILDGERGVTFANVRDALRALSVPVGLVTA
jgi:antitoxin HicB